MGYTHYWTLKTDIDPERWGGFTALAGKVLAATTVPVAKRRHGYMDEKGAIMPPAVSRIEVSVNGLGSQGGEGFTMLRMASEPSEVPEDGRDFSCKTEERPYDEVVTALLLAAKESFGRDIEVSSDGEWRDWTKGRALFEKATGRVAPCPWPEVAVASEERPVDIVSAKAGVGPEVHRQRLAQPGPGPTPETGGFDVRGEELLAFLEGGKWTLDVDLTQRGPHYGTWDHEFLYRRAGSERIARVALDSMSLLTEVYANETDLENAACIDGKDRGFSLRPMSVSIARFVSPLGRAYRAGRGMER